MTAFPETPEEKAVVDGVNAGIALCQRNSQRIDESENEILWFKLLDAVVIPLRRLKGQRNRLKVTAVNLSLGNSSAKLSSTGSSQKMDSTSPLGHRMSQMLKFARPRIIPGVGIKRSKQGLEEVMRVILSNMMGQVQLRAILDKIVMEHGADEFGDFRWILSGMLPLIQQALHFQNAQCVFGSAMTDQYSYEISTMRTVLQLLHGDTNRLVHQLYKVQRR